MKKFLRKTKVISRLLIILIVIMSIVCGKPVTETEASTETPIEIPEEEISKEETTEGLSQEEPEIPLEPSMPGRIEGTGTCFEIKDSKYLNIILKSTKEIKVVLESMPRMISLDIETALEEISSTVLTLEGLEPNKTYYKYQESYKNEAVFISDEKGNYSWSQDLTKPYHIWIQEIRGTILIPDQCSDCGIWDEETSTCTLTQDLTESVVIIADNINLDGNGHIIKGEGTGDGILLWEKKNVTIKNCVISNFYYGIYLAHSANNKLLNNHISNNNLNGIKLRASSGNTINGNTVNSSKYGINLGQGFDPHANPIPSNNNIIINNTINSNQYNGIFLSNSSNNTITNNAILNNGYGIRLDASSDNNLAENIVSLNNEGISFLHSTDNTLTNNKINSNKGSGIFFSHSSSNNTLRNNTISENQYNLGFYWNDAPEAFVQDIDSSNTINGKPIYYLVNEEDKEISGEAGFIGLVNSSGITVKNLTLNNNWSGVLLVSTENSKIENIHASNNYHGIYLINSLNNNFINNNVSNNESALHLRSSSNNIFNGNTVRSNNSCAIYLSYASDNIFYHNNFIDNLLIYPSCFLSQVHYSTPPQIKNIFDNGYPVGGNYWSDYTGVDEKNGFNQDQAGSDGIGDSPYGIYYYHYFTSTSEKINQDNYPFMVESGWEVSKPDFWIDEVKPVQVVWNSKIDNNNTIDLVAGKSTMVRVEVGMKDYEALPKDFSVEIQFTFDGKAYPSEIRTIEELEQNNQIDFYPDPPVLLGNQTIVAKVIPKDKIKETDKNNNEKTIEVTVKDTNSLHIVYFPIFRPSTWLGYGPLDLEEYATTVSQSAKFIKATYPVDEEELIIQKEEDLWFGSPAPWLGILWDILTLWAGQELSTKTLGDRAVGIVPENYFSYHLVDYSGLYIKGVHAVLAEVGDWPSPAHEIGHTYGLEDGYDTKINYIGDSASGFWVSEGREIYPLNREILEGGLDFMGSTGSKNSFYWDALKKKVHSWISKENYEKLFKEFRTDENDPPDVLLMSGLIFKDDTVKLNKLYTLEQGITDQVAPGDYSVQILNGEGKPLASIPFDASFFMYTEPSGIVEIDVTAFAFVIPYPETASEIKIQHNGEVLATFNPSMKLLHDAIDSIPDHGFTKNPEQRRNSLHHEIDAVEKMLDANGIKGAIHKLEHDIKDKLEKWLVDDYPLENPLQLPKTEIINLVNKIIVRLTIQ